MKYIFLYVPILFLLSCDMGNNSKNRILINELIIENKECIHINDSLTEKLSSLKENYWFDNEFEGKSFLENGIKNSQIEIENEIRKRLDLIPLSATLGGNMTFDKVQLLGSNWLIASYSDGHVSGRVLYEFNLNDVSQFEFKIIDSKVD